MYKYQNEQQSHGTHTASKRNSIGILLYYSLSVGAFIFHLPNYVEDIQAWVDTPSRALYS